MEMEMELQMENGMEIDLQHPTLGYLVWRLRQIYRLAMIHYSDLILCSIKLGRPQRTLVTWDKKCT